MDVKRGHCWRCEKSTDETSDVCSLCKIATYCSVQCRDEDQYRHKPECEVWGPKKCNNPKCSAVSRQLYLCTGCTDAWYCGKPCQQEDRKYHKNVCRQHTDAVKTAAGNLRPHYRRNLSGTALGIPYYIGNSLPADMLNLEENECSKHLSHEEQESAAKESYNILAAGCGNLCDVIHTVASLPQEFLGKVDVTLNDFDPFVQARNVLFLYMMIVFATRSDIATIVTTLWYSVHLSSKDYKFLQDCLKTLSDISGSALACSTQGLVTVREEYMPQLREVWQGWLELQCQRSHPKSIDLRKQRQELFARDPDASIGIPFFKRRIPKEYRQSFVEWLQSGVFLPSGSDNQKKEYDNPTMIGYYLKGEFYLYSEAHHLRSPKLHKFIYCVDSDIYPFMEWDQLLVQKHSSSKSLVVLYHAYITNQVQQTVAFLNSKRLVTTIHVCDCLELPSRLPSEATFDRICTSNIADYIGTKNLLRAFKGLLNTTNKCATIFTKYRVWFRAFPYACLDVHPNDSIVKECLVAAANDTKDLDATMRGLHLPEEKNFGQEYFNFTMYFISFMRSELMACDESLPTTKAVPFQQVLKTEGLKMRDFRRELNRVVPFAYRRNIRPINLRRGLDRAVEWQLSK